MRLVYDIEWVSRDAFKRGRCPGRMERVVWFGPGQDVSEVLQNHIPAALSSFSC